MNGGGSVRITGALESLQFVTQSLYKISIKRMQSRLRSGPEQIGLSGLPEDIDCTSLSNATALKWKLMVAFLSEPDER